MKRWYCQASYREHISAIITTFCRYYDVKIARRSYFSDHCIDGIFPPFSEVEKFCKKWEFEYIKLPFVKAHLDEQFLPAFVIKKDHRVQLVVSIKEGVVNYVDAVRGWLETPLDAYFDDCAGEVILVEPSSYRKDLSYKENEQIDTLELENKRKSFGIKEIEGFLSPEECDQLIALGENSYVRSTVVSEEGKPFKESDVRTSSSAFLLQKHNFLDEIRERASLIIGVPKEHFENVQLTSYNSGQQYDIHSDSWEVDEKSTEGQRTHTILIYLNDDFEGGATLFPVIDTEVKARKGNAVVWTSLTDEKHIDPRGFHGGLPVKSGRKIICNLWVRDKMQANWQ